MGSCEIIMAAVRQASKAGFLPIVKRWAYNLSGFNQYGLWRDDCREFTPEVAEAVRRLPAHIYDERQFRISRALLLSCKKTILPKEEWTQYEQDVQYLKPYLEEVKAE